ncbi:hypothetical protein U746_2793 [Mycolicibacterium mucogenicum 261Sha1.1M5]|nr:hypothetical protein U746_2793 [Mycolicibacterium mucogenicum 261Sha1.1M5]
MLAADEHKLSVAAVDVQSGDPYIVEDALGVMRASFLDALDREYPGVTDTPLVGTMCGAIAACVSVAVVALGAAIVAVTFNVAGAINIIYNQNGLWNQNGHWHGSESPDTSSASDGQPQYPDLSSGEVIRRITVALSR